MTSTFSSELRIPKERVAVLIGANGSVKSTIESQTKTKINVDSEEGFVVISGKDALNIYSAKEIVKAIGRGFNPDIARLLLKPDYGFEIVDVKEFAKTKNDLKRLKGRVIGKEGKSRRVIEDLTNTNISVYGKTIGIIGEVEMIPLARKAIESLLKGGRHGNIYKWLEKQRVQLKLRELI